MNIQMAKKWPEMVVTRSFIKGHSFPITLYNSDAIFEWKNVWGFLFQRGTLAILSVPSIYRVVLNIDIREIILQCYFERTLKFEHINQK